MVARKDTVVKQNNDGILYLFKKNKVAFFHGRGSFVRPSRAVTKSRSSARLTTC
jgi:dihydrolipoamide dehydrogenase